ncbi:hypothetical protein FLACOL_00347 [Flavobacterium columnare]|uniref:DUF4838 domain-containing protein n=2 Tax=Flavobacterium TaxID=237 RepID=A0ABW8PMW7_9FLAO|nr:DUF4838 domain-containing protein [Flavobacterium columnare]SPE76368.1 hypothetical protein FLACOL_00347 [Flavobacterium columnare]
MIKEIFSSNSTIVKLCLAIVFFFVSSGCSLKAHADLEDVKLYSDQYKILFEHQTKLKKLEKDYFYNEFKKRTSKPEIISKNKNLEGLLIKVILSSENLFDYQIKVQENKEIQLIANSEKNLKWLFNQFLKKLSIQDDRIITQDLLPAIISIKENTVRFPFEYREPHFNPVLQTESDIRYNCNNVENDWGIWGHNLGKLLIEENSSQTFALVENKRNKSQICFSSDATYKFLKNYIIDNFGLNPHKNYAFMIIPNDNDFVCLDSKCKNLGNTISNATPSVIYLIEKLAKEFPKYNFFTTSYRTTEIPPIKKTSKNVGVMISTIDFPKNVHFEKKPEVKKFEEKCMKWKEKVNKIYLWDYASNFDDYLTPYPFFYRFKKQLEYFNEIGIKGVFVNGSGYDYTSFQELKTFVVSSLLIDYNLKIEDLIKNYFKQEFPQNHEFLSEYYLDFEKLAEKQNLSCSIYDKGIKNLNPLHFFHFYEKLNKLANATQQTKERIKIRELLVALSFTYLKLSLENGNTENGYYTIENNTMSIKPQIIEVYNRLKQHINYQDLKNFKEENGSIQAFLKEFEEEIIKNKYPLNKLFSKKLEALSKLDEDYPNINVLNDNSVGLISDYHYGWLLTSQEDLAIRLPSIEIENATLKVNFLNNPDLKIFLPIKVQVYKNGVLWAELTESPGSKQEKRKGIYTTKITILKNDNIVIKTITDTKNRKTACDEIQLF